MKEIFQGSQDDICEIKEIGCNSIYCEAPDYIRRAMFLNDPKRHALFAIVTKSVISNLALRTLENVDRDPVAIAQTNLPAFSCIKASVSSFSRDELGTFFAKECVGTIGRVAKAVSLKTATREDAFLYDCLVKMGAHQEINKNGGINRDELLKTIEWYFSGDSSEKAPVGAKKYADLEKIKEEKPQDSPRKHTYSSFSYKRTKEAQVEGAEEVESSEISSSVSSLEDNQKEKESAEKSLLTPREKAIVTLCAQGKAMGKIAEILTVSFDRISINARTIVEKFGAKHLEQVIFQMISEGEINLAEVVDTYAVKVINSLDPSDLNLLDLITTSPYQLASDEEIAEKLGLSCRTLRSRFLNIRRKLYVPNRIVAGVAYLAYKQSRIEEPATVLNR